MNVLVVDDQYEVVQAVISGVNWQKLSVSNVFAAYSVEEAKSLFRREAVDILLCDIEMPPTNGFELLRWAQERQPGIISIFLSAHAEFEYAREAVKLGSFDYILQPAPYEEIEKAVERAVSKASEAERRLMARRDGKQQGATVSTPPPPDGDDRRPLEKAMDYIRRNIERDLSRKEIAEAVFLNPEYLSHLFKKETGSSLGEYIISEKMRVAQSLLADTNIQVGVIASKVGYTNFSYFSQVFKKHTGFSPLEYRAQRKAPGANNS